MSHDVTDALPKTMLIYRLLDRAEHISHSIRLNHELSVDKRGRVVSMDDIGQLTPVSIHC